MLSIWSVDRSEGTSTYAMASGAMSPPQDPACSDVPELDVIASPVSVRSATGRPRQGGGLNSSSSSASSHPKSSGKSMSASPSSSSPLLHSGGACSTSSSGSSQSGSSG